jgi:cytochrome c-type biogenesis protein CcmF
MFIGIAGGAFNQSREAEMGFGDSMTLGPYKIVCQSFTQDSNFNYDTEYALLDVYKYGKKLYQLAPEKRFYIASQQPGTVVANHSNLENDLYTIYEGKNPDTGRPIIKVFINPLIAWIWIGVAIIGFGTVLALLPNLTRAAFRAPVEIPTEIPSAAPPPVLTTAKVQNV